MVTWRTKDWTRISRFCFRFLSACLPICPRYVRSDIVWNHTFLITLENISNTGTPSTEGEGDNAQHARELSKRFCDEAFRQIVGDTTSSTISIYKFSSWFRGAAIPPQVDRTTAIQIKRRLAGIEDEKDIPVVVRNETVSTKNSIKQWVDYDVSPAKCT